MDALAAHLGPAQRTELLAAMDTIRRLLDRPGPPTDAGPAAPADAGPADPPADPEGTP
jgi:hypothetical protein